MNLAAPANALVAGAFGAAVDRLLLVGMARAPAVDHAIHFRPASGALEGGRFRMTRQKARMAMIVARSRCWLWRWRGAMGIYSGGSTSTGAGHHHGN